MRRPDPDCQGFRTAQLPSQVKGFGQNRVWLALVALAGEISARTSMLAFDDHQARRWELKRMRLRIFSVPAIAARHARRIVVKIKDTATSAVLVIDAITRLRNLTGPAPG